MSEKTHLDSKMKQGSSGSKLTVNPGKDCTTSIEPLAFRREDRVSLVCEVISQHLYLSSSMNHTLETRSVVVMF